MFKSLLALAAVGIAAVRSAKVPGDELQVTKDVTFDNAYPTGGEVVTPEQFGLREFTGSGGCEIKNGSESEEFPIGGAFFDYANGKVLLQNSKTGKEVANGKDASKVVVRVTAIGR